MPSSVKGHPKQMYGSKVLTILVSLICLSIIQISEIDMKDEFITEISSLLNAVANAINCEGDISCTVMISARVSKY